MCIYVYKYGLKYFSQILKLYKKIVKTDIYPFLNVQDLQNAGRTISSYSDR